MPTFVSDVQTLTAFDHAAMSGLGVHSTLGVVEAVGCRLNHNLYYVQLNATEVDVHSSPVTQRMFCASFKHAPSH